MQTINLNDRTIYRASKGKKVKFTDDDRLYSEIVVDLDNNREIEEVNEDGNV